MKHKLTQTIHTHVICGKCDHKWKVSGKFVVYKCPKCKHAHTTKNSL